MKIFLALFSCSIFLMAGPAQVAEIDTTQVSKGLREFAFDAYQHCQSKPGNFLVSPDSLFVALTMAYAGAKGQTATEMAQTLHLPAQTDVHAANKKLDDSLSSTGQVWLANTLFIDAGYKPFLKAPYLNIVAVNYGSGVQVLDFLHHPEPARQSINSWVSGKTQSKINDLIPPGAVTVDTAVVLANTVYLKAAWAAPFDPNLTVNKDFRLPTGDVSVPMMFRMATYNYMETPNLQAIELPYKNQRLSMVVILPRRDLAGLEKTLNAAQFDSIVHALASTEVRLSLPKFTFDHSLSAKSLLVSLGMRTAFNDRAADFSALAHNPRRPLYISDVLHKVFMKIDEAGTEAAAATGVIMPGATSSPVAPPAMLVNKPFIFAIRDMNTGVLLFLGRVQDPR